MKLTIEIKDPKMTSGRYPDSKGKILKETLTLDTETGNGYWSADFGASINRGPFTLNDLSKWAEFVNLFVADGNSEDYEDFITWHNLAILSEDEEATDVMEGLAEAEGYNKYEGLF